MQFCCLATGVRRGEVVSCGYDVGAAVSGWVVLCERIGADSLLEWHCVRRGLHGSNDLPCRERVHRWIRHRVSRCSVLSPGHVGSGSLPCILLLSRCSIGANGLPGGLFVRGGGVGPSSVCQRRAVCGGSVGAAVSYRLVLPRRHRHGVLADVLLRRWIVRADPVSCWILLREPLHEGSVRQRERLPGWDHLSDPLRRWILLRSWLVRPCVVRLGLLLSHRIRVPEPLRRGVRVLIDDHSRGVCGLQVLPNGCNGGDCLRGGGVLPCGLPEPDGVRRGVCVCESVAASGVRRWEILPVWCDGRDRVRGGVQVPCGIVCSDPVLPGQLLQRGGNSGGAVLRRKVL